MDPRDRDCYMGGLFRDLAVILRLRHVVLLKEYQAAFPTIGDPELRAIERS